MEMVNFRDVRNEEQKKQANELSASLKQDNQLLSLLQKNNISSKHLDTHPYKIQSWYKDFQACIRCGGLKNCKQKEEGYFDQLVDDGFLHIEKCPCKYMKEKMQERKHLNQFLVNDMPDHLTTVDFNKILLEKESGNYIEVFTESLNQYSRNQGVYLYGTLGGGKTYLAACAANGFAKQGKKVAFIHYPTFIQRMTSRVQTNEYMNEVEKLQYVYFLVIDEIGGEPVTQWNRDSILLPILNARYEKGLPTWFTSNESLESLEEHFRFNNKSKDEDVKAMRIMDRIQAMSKPLCLECENKRIYK